jgi:hypothetical protein
MGDRITLVANNSMLAHNLHVWDQAISVEPPYENVKSRSAGGAIFDEVQNRISVQAEE